MNKTKRKGLVPYDSVPLCFEAVYTDKKPSTETENEQEYVFPVTLDESGRAIQQWPIWFWTKKKENWDEEIKCINKKQVALGTLAEETRQIRAHIGSLVPCDSGIPVTIDELLYAIGKGKLDEPSFHNGCWNCCPWWESKGTQPHQIKSMKIIHDVVEGFLKGKSKEYFADKFPDARGFIYRTYEWLGSVSELTKLQQLMIKRMLLPFDYFTRSYSDRETLNWDFFMFGGSGPEIDKEISTVAGLPKIYPIYRPEYQENLAKISNLNKQELYKVCCHIAQGVQGLSDCHHSTFRYIENWIFSIGTGKWGISTRKKGTEKERLGFLLFGYVLGLDKWLLGKPMQFVLLDLGHVDLGFNPRNEILRVYTYLGEEKTPVKEWLATSLWYTLAYHPLLGDPVGLFHRHPELIQRASKVGIGVREWMDSVLKK